MQKAVTLKAVGFKTSVIMNIFFLVVCITVAYAGK